MGQLDLAVLIGQQPCLGALQNAEASALKTRGMASLDDAFTARFDADHFHAFVLEKGVEQADGVAAPTDAGDEKIRQALFTCCKIWRRASSPITR